ncbi:MAG: adenylyl-sulfate kinase [Bdellovibrionia bacterium]
MSNLPISAIWITGQSAAGKSTLAQNLFEHYKNQGATNLVLLDGEELRAKLTRKYGYTVEERFAVFENILSAVKSEILKGNSVIVATITHKKAMRLKARTELKNFFEVYLECPTKVCAQRDYKGNYEKALSGKMSNMIGVDEPYEISDSPELIIHSATNSIEQVLKIAIGRYDRFVDQITERDAESADHALENGL